MKFTRVKNPSSVRNEISNPPISEDDDGVSSSSSFYSCLATSTYKIINDFREVVGISQYFLSNTGTKDGGSGKF